MKARARTSVSLGMRAEGAIDRFALILGHVGAPRLQFYREVAQDDRMTKEDHTMQVRLVTLMLLIALPAAVDTAAGQPNEAELKQRYDAFVESLDHRRLTPATGTKYQPWAMHCSTYWHRTPPCMLGKWRFGGGRWDFPSSMNHSTMAIR